MSPKKTLCIKISLRKSQQVKISKARIVITGVQSSLTSSNPKNACNLTIKQKTNSQSSISSNDVLRDRSFGEKREPDHLLSEFMSRPFNRVGLCLGVVSSSSKNHTQFKQMATKGSKLNKIVISKFKNIGFGDKLKANHCLNFFLGFLPLLFF